MGREQSVQIYLVTIEMQKPATIEIGPFPPLIMRGFSTRFYILDNRFFSPFYKRIFLKAVSTSGRFETGGQGGGAPAPPLFC